MSCLLFRRARGGTRGALQGARARRSRAAGVVRLGVEMLSALDDLRRWFAALPPPPTPVHWAWVESELGFALPSDYKEFCDRFGGCRVQWLFVHAPFGQRMLTDGKDLVEGRFGLSLYDYRGALGWPDFQNLLLWGEIDSDPLLCWDK